MVRVPAEPSVIAAFVLSLLVLSVAAWLWAPAAWRGLRRSRIRAQAFAPHWRDVLRRRMPAFALLPADVQWRLKKNAQVLMAETPFIGCAGLQITDEMRVLVSVQAALLLRPGTSHFENLRQVLIYPGAFAVQRSTEAAAWVREERHALVGESWQQGQVILSWEEVLRGAADPGDGQNVVLHEFAHQLDQAHGQANGAPWLPGAQSRARWAQVMTAEFQALQRRLANKEPGLIEAYAASNPGEFFAVLSELYFEKPLELAQQHPALYAQFRGLYGVDPLSWLGTTATLQR
jgi:MtfA peptidase